MKIYKKMIRPMVRPPCLQGFNDSSYPLYKGDYWVDDTNEDSLKNTWEWLVKRADPMGMLEIEEKYVEIELPKPEVINVKPGDTVCLTFNNKEIDIDTACEYLKKYNEILPEGVALCLLPSIFSLDVLDKEETYIYIDEYKKIVDRKYNNT